MSIIPTTTAALILFFPKKFAPGTTARAGVLPGVLPGTHANPRENPEEPEEDLHPVVDPAIALQRSRHGRALRPRHDPNFDYSISFLDSVLPLHGSTLSARDHSFALFAASLPSHANSGSPPLAFQGSAFPSLRKQLKEAG